MTVTQATRVARHEAGHTAAMIMAGLAPAPSDRRLARVERPR